MPIVLNEVKESERIIESGEVGNKPTSTLFLLGKYYRQKENLNKSDTYNKLNEFMERNYKNYNSALWEDIIEDISKKATKYSLKCIDYISITRKELDQISGIHDLKYERLLFTMLCYAKLGNMNSEKNNNWINTKISEIYKVARVPVRYAKDKFLMINDLWQADFISFSNKNDNLNIRVNFVDMNGECVLQINDFRELGYEYLNYIGSGKFIRCSKCGRLVRKKSKKDFSTKYCKQCTNDILHIQKHKWDVNNRKIRKS